MSIFSFERSVAAEAEGPGAELVGDRWLAQARLTPDRDAVLHYAGGELAHRWSWGELMDGAREFAGMLSDLGVRSGDVCALIVRHHPFFYPLYMGVELLGAVPAVLAYPNPRLHPDKFRSGLEGMSRTSGLDWILTERDLAEMLGGMLDGATTVRGLLFPLEPIPDADAPALASRRFDQRAWLTLQASPRDRSADCIDE